MASVDVMHSETKAPGEEHHGDKRRNILIAMDGSKHSDHAFECKSSIFEIKYVVLVQLVY